MLSGASVKVNTLTFQNDIANIRNKDDVLTYLIHLGYLGYDQPRKEAFVPNEDTRNVLLVAINYSKSKQHECVIEQYTKN